MAVSLSSAARDEAFSSAGRVVWLVDFPDLTNGTHFLTNYSNDIDYNGNTYSPFDLEIPTKTVSASEDITKATLQISNLDYKAQKWYVDNNGLEGETVTLTTLSPDATSSSDKIREKQYQIDTYDWDKRWGQISLTPFYDFLQNLSTEPITRDHCGKSVPRQKKLQRRHIKKASDAEAS